MANDIKNALKVIGEESLVAELFASIRYEDSLIDFNKIIPMPSELQVISDVNIRIMDSVEKALHINKGEALKTYQNPLEFSDEDWAIYIQFLNNVRKYGYMCWYDWAFAKWNTKFNAIEPWKKNENDDTIYFITAWDAPVSVIVQLSKNFPTLTLILEWCKYDDTYLVKHDTLTICNGVITNSYFTYEDFIKSM